MWEDYIIKNVLMKFSTYYHLGTRTKPIEIDHDWSYPNVPSETGFQGDIDLKNYLYFVKLALP